MRHLAQFTNKSWSQVHKILKKHLKLNAQWVPRGGEGYSNTFIYMYMKARPFWGDLKFWISIFIYYYFFFFFFFGSENWIIMENADFVDTFWEVITKLDYLLSSSICIYRSFLTSMYRTGLFLWVAYLLLLFFFWGVGVNSRSLV